MAGPCSLYPLCRGLYVINRARQQIHQVNSTSGNNNAGNQQVGPMKAASAPNRFPLFVPPRSPFQQLYIQAGSIGAASYWFDSNLSESYILYDPAVIGWRLDDGSLPPVKKYFENPSYDPSTRTFQGVIRWEPVAFNGDSRWEYRIVFSENFTIIESGEVVSHGETEKTHAYQRDLQYRIAIGPGTKFRLKEMVTMITIMYCTIPRVKRKTLLHLLPIDVLREVRKYLYE
jgi:hypothetical protein